MRNCFFNTVVCFRARPGGLGAGLVLPLADRRRPGPVLYRLYPGLGQTFTESRFWTEFVGKVRWFLRFWGAVRSLSVFYFRSKTFSYPFRNFSWRSAVFIMPETNVSTEILNAIGLRKSTSNFHSKSSSLQLIWEVISLKTLGWKTCWLPLVGWS